MSDGSAIALRGIAKCYGGTRNALSGITFDTGESEILCIVGKSGCGKSTLLHLVCGIEAPTEGEVDVKGSVGCIPQRDLLLPWRNVLENTLLPLELRDAVTEEQLEKASAILAELGLSGTEQMYPDELSGGMRQRVSLARALLQDADIMLFDEPFSAVDFDARLKLGKALRTWLKQRCKVALFVTHHIEEALALGDRVLVLGGAAGGIVLNVPVTFPEEQRDPLAVRCAPEFPRLFETIWRAM